MKGDLEYRLPSHKINNISSNLLSLRNTMPREFSRKPRTMSEFRHWKATELRQFLLYTGPVVLCDILLKQMYQNFVTLSVAINCLLSPDFAGKVEYQNYAEKLLINFVLNFKQIYGASQLVYNVHSLIHLAQDCRKFGVLDNVSAFPYENYLGMLKKWVRRPQNPIAQIVCRIAEKESIIKHNYTKGNEELAEKTCSGKCIMMGLFHKVCLNIFISSINNTKMVNTLSRLLKDIIVLKSVVNHPQ